MRVIMDLVDKIDEEIEGAKEYAEKYLELKASGSETNSEWANKFKAMSNQELEHSGHIHSYAMEKIEELRKVYSPPAEMLEVWDIAHKKFIERAAWIKQMLTM